MTPQRLQRVLCWALVALFLVYYSPPAAKAAGDDLSAMVSEHHVFENVLKLNISAFTKLLSTKPKHILAMFTDDECGESCTRMGSYFTKTAELYGQRRQAKCKVRDAEDNYCEYPPHVAFVNAHDKYGAIMDKFKLESIPRIVFFESGKSVLVPHFGTTKEKEEGLYRFLMRMIQPEIVRIHTEKDLEQFLFPPDDDVRDHIVEDPVSFVFIEPETGSMRARLEYQTAAKKYRAKRFLAHVKWAESDWNRALNITNDIIPPAIVRVETGRPSRLLLNGPDEYFKSNAVSDVIGRYAFPTLPDIAAFNFRDILENDAGLISVIRLYTTAEERDAAKKELWEILGHYPGHLYVTLNRTQFPNFLLPMVEQDTDAFAYYKKSGMFWMKDHPKQDLKEFVERLLLHKIPAQYETGTMALPRLIRKAVAKSPLLLVGLIAFILILFAVGWYCVCGFRHTLFGEGSPLSAARRNEEQHEKTE